MIISIRRFLKLIKVLALLTGFKYLPIESLLIMYKTFIRPHLDYEDVIYDFPENSTFSQKLKSVQYNACLAITGSFRRTSRDKLYSELGLESLHYRRFNRRLFNFYKIIINLAARYLVEYLPAQIMLVT